MNIVKPSFIEIKDDNLFKKIEHAGRTCYKSENLITESSALDFARRIVSYNHGSVLEHAYLVFKIDEDLYNKLYKKHLKFVKFSNITYPIISFNFRAFYNLYISNDDVDLYPIYHYMEDHYSELLSLKHDSSIKVEKLSFEDVYKLSQEEKDLHLSITLKITTDRGVTHELVRHRLASYAQESTRYCNYSKDKFNNELTFVETYGMDEAQRDCFIEACANAEKSYFKMLSNGAKAETARSVLPNALKTEIVVTSTIDEWKIIFDLRCAPAAHPDIRFLMIDIKNYFKERGYL